MTGPADRDRLRLLADRAAWLRNEAVEVRRSVLSDPSYGDDYWASIEGTAAWETFVLARRARDLRTALVGRRRKR